ncbi:MAG: quinone-dependent dihydroorotate dehydrogenase [Alphaproteobacteria bacterium]|nr:quinone-dependent dihydroorotate dehydrogenase [Alphaproteobacteria bacterium]
MQPDRLLLPFVHLLPPEQAHALGLWALKRSLLPSAPITPNPFLEQKLFGLPFANPVGLAAGFDKNAEATGPLLRQGFGFVEAGTVTPLPQEGNPAPRMFRLKKDAAVINRLGFNNKGIDAFVHSLSAREKGGIVGANIGKNKNAEDAIGDYVTCLNAVYAYADYIAINISSPNTQGLRTLQKREQLTQLLTTLMTARNRHIAAQGKKVPLLLKIAPDLSEPEMEDVADVALSLAVDGIIISNTTIKRPRTLQSSLHGEQGGLSGAPLFALSTEVLARMYVLTKGAIPLVGVGGISTAQDAYKKIRAGASLVQLYTALVYQGFGVVRDIVEGLPVLLAKDGFAHISDAVGVDHAL